MKQTKRNKEVHVRFTDEEHARLKARADASGKSVGAYIRTATLNDNPVHIRDGKEVAQKLGQIQNKLILYHNDMQERMKELKESVQAYTTMMQDSGIRLLTSPAVQGTAKLLDMRVEAAVGMIIRAYHEYENQTENELQQVVQKG